MASINNLEPQAFGLITFRTTFGDIEVELFTKQCPKITRQFVQYCLDGYYEGISFHRVEKDFIAIAGDAEINEQYHTCPDEFNSRLRFSRRGLLATANLKKDENGPEFFFTLGSTPELQNKHTIFGRVKGNSIYNLVDLNECQVDNDFKPFSEHKITKVLVADNPFPNLVAKPPMDRNTARNNETANSSSELYDPLLKPKLTEKNLKRLSFYPSDDEEDEDGEASSRGNSSRVEKKSQSKIMKAERSVSEIPTNVEGYKEETILEKESLGTEKESLTEKPLDAKEQRLREIRAQILSIKNQIEQETETKTLSERRREAKSTNQCRTSSEPREITADDRIESKKSRYRDRETIELVSNFKKRLREASIQDKSDMKQCDKLSQDEFDLDELAALEKADSDQWLKHKFEPEDDSVLAKDANSKDDSWYSIDDPRNSMNKRHSNKLHRDHFHHKYSRHSRTRD